MKRHSALRLMVLAGWIAVAHALTAQPVPDQSSGKRKLLIIEAEDLGMAHSIDRASIYAMEHAWVTSGGVLVTGPWFPEVVQWAHNHPDDDLGVRLDLTSEWPTYRWRPVSQAHSLSDSGGYLRKNASDVIRNASLADVIQEVKAQTQLASAAAIRVSHLDQRIMLVNPSMFQIFVQLGKEAKVPVLVSREFIQSHCSPTGEFYLRDCDGLKIDLRRVLVDRDLQIMPGFSKKEWLNAYESALRRLQPGSYLLRVHLGFNDDELKAMTAGHPNWGAEWRQNDYDVISSPEFHKFLRDQGFILVSWKDLEKRASEVH